MKRARFVAFLAFTVAIQSPTIAEQAESGGVPQQVVKLYSSGPRALAMLTLGDGPPAPVVFDTGEDQTLIVASYAKLMKLEVVGSSQFVDESTGATTTVPSLKLPSPRLSGVAASPELTRMLELDEPDMVGIFGPGAFPGSLVTLELSHDRVRISPMTTGSLPTGPATPYFHHLPALNIDVAGVPVLAHLDSGSDLGLSLSRSLMGKVKLKQPPIVIGRANSALGEQDVYGGEIDGDVAVGPLLLHNPEVSFVGAGEGANIGYQLLRQLTLVMDPSGQRSWVLNPKDEAPFSVYVGSFGSRTISLRSGQLIYQREGRPAFPLTSLGSGLFENVATGDRLQFFIKDQCVTRFDFITASGTILRVDRTA